MSNEKSAAVREKFGRGNTYKIIKENSPVGQPCDCCGVEMHRPNFDHCHETNVFRGWLCHSCNTGIGKLGDNLEGLMRAVEYLQNTTKQN